MRDTTALQRKIEDVEGVARNRDAVSLRLLLPGTRIRVQSWSDSGLPQAALAAVVGAPWPTVVGRSSGDRTRVLCFGPTDWLVLSDGAADAWVRDLEEAAKGSTLSVTDVSQGLVAIEVAGVFARDLLAKACSLDVHARAFGPGVCARTRFADIAVIVHVVADGDAFHCYVSRSYVEYLLQWLTDAAAEFLAASS